MSKIKASKSNQFRVTRRTLLGGAAVMLGAPSIVRAATATKEVSIGAVLPITGPSAGFGQDCWAAVQAGCNYVNARGGIRSMGGAMLKPVLGDSESKPEVAASQVESLARKGVVSIIGCAQSSATIVASQQAERLKIPMLCANDGDPKITARGFKHIFRMSPTHLNYVADNLAYIKTLIAKHGGGNKKMAILVENTALGMLTQQLAKELAEQNNMIVVDNSTYEAGKTQNFASYIAKYKSLGVDVYVGYNIPVDSIAIVRAMKEQNFNPVAFTGVVGGPSTQVFLDNLGSDADGILTSLPWINLPSIPGLTDVAAAYKEVSGKDMDMSAAGVLADVSVMWDSLERAASTDWAVVRDAISATDMKLGDRGYVLLDGVKFKDTGDNARALSVVAVIRGGKWLAVSPSSLAQTEAAFPKPKWS